MKLADTIRLFTRIECEKNHQTPFKIFHIACKLLWYSLLWTFYHLNRQQTTITCRLVDFAQFSFTFGNKNTFGSRMHLCMCVTSSVCKLRRSILWMQPQNIVHICTCKHTNTAHCNLKIRWDNLQSTILQTHSHRFPFVHRSHIVTHINMKWFWWKCLICVLYATRSFAMPAGGYISSLVVDVRCASYDYEYTGRCVLPATPNSLAERFASGVVKTLWAAAIFQRHC